MKKRGFTMIELSLSLTFIALLSVIIVLIITDAVSAYHRGITLNQVNSVGADLVDDIRASIENAPGQTVEDECKTLYAIGTARKNCLDDDAMSFTQLKRTANVTIKEETFEETFNVPIYGIYCTGSYSYIWNSGYFFSDDATVQDGIGPISVKYKVYTDDGGTEIKTFPAAGEEAARLIKINDPERMLCKSVAGYKTEDSDISGGNYIESTNLNFLDDIDMTQTTIDDDPTDLLAGDVSLALYDLTVAAPAESESAVGIFHSVSMILGTIQGGINITVAGNYCATPDGYNAAVENFDYCAINKFNFAARAMGD